MLFNATEILGKEGFFMLDFRTDLADERKDLYKKANNIENEIDGIEATEEQINNPDSFIPFKKVF